MVEPRIATRVAAGLVLTTLWLPSPKVGAESAGLLTLASISEEGFKGNGGSLEASLSADGTRVAFWSTADNLDPADVDRSPDVFVKDLLTGDLSLASSSEAGDDANGWTDDPSLSAQGTRVAFSSQATNLHPGDHDRWPDIYVKDLASGALTLASTSDTGVKGVGYSFAPALAADGGRVAFESDARLDPADRDDLYDIYVKELMSGDLTLVSTSDQGVKGTHDSDSASLSADGMKVAFRSDARNLDPADTDAIPDIYVKDLLTGDITLVSTSDGGVKGNGESLYPSISADGTTVAFESRASNLDPSDPDTKRDIYVKDLATGDLALASTSDSGRKGRAPSVDPALSADGLFVTFESGARLDPGDDRSDIVDVYVKDLLTGDVSLVSTSSQGVKGNGSSYSPAISADGVTVAFYTYSNNLDPNDTDLLTDVYVKDV